MADTAKNHYDEIGLDDTFDDDEDATTDQFSSASGSILISLVTKLMPCRCDGRCVPAECEEKSELWAAVRELLPILPTSSLANIIYKLGGRLI